MRKYRRKRSSLNFELIVSTYLGEIDENNTVADRIGGAVFFDENQ
jgi:hypothetical protein